MSHVLRANQVLNWKSME